MKIRNRSIVVRAGLFSLAALSVVTCAVDPSPPSGIAEQAAIGPQLPNLNLILNAKTTIAIGAFTSVNGDVASGGANGSVAFDVASSQFGAFNVLANSVTVDTQAAVGHVFGNDITVDGFAVQQQLGLDPSTLPQVPAVGPAAPGTKNVSTSENQLKQLCPGQYGAISLGLNSTLNLNGGVYHVTRLTLADGARLEPSEPVVIFVSGGVTTGVGSAIRPSAQALDPMTAADVRIEVGGAVTVGNSNQIRAHLLVTNKFQAGKNLDLIGAAWARNITIGSNSAVNGEGSFSVQAPSVPPPCNDHNACTADVCVGGGTAVGFCSNAPVPAGTSCGDDNACNGAELCNAAGQCQPGTIQPAGTACPDGDVCNGDEACNAFGSCVDGAPPILTDDNACTADACDAEAGVIHTPLPDGTQCNGAGVCTAGTCVGGTVSGSFSYTASNTNNATQNTTDFDIAMAPGQTLLIGTCNVPGASGAGDTFLRLIDPNGNLVALNDDGGGPCGLLSFLGFIAAVDGVYQVRAGCFASESCGGTVAFTLSP